MTKAWDWMKEHPYITSAILVVGGLLIFLMFFHKPAGANAPVDNTAALAGLAASNVASGNQLAATQLQAQVAGSQIQSDAATAATNDATAVQLAQLQANATTTAGQQQVDAAKAVNDATVAVTGINANAAVQISSIAATASAQQSYDTSTLAAYNTLSAANTANTSSTLNFLTGLANGIVGGSTPVIGTSGSVNFSTSPSGVLNGVNYNLVGTPAPTPPAVDPRIANISNLYQSLLGRAPDTAGLQYYLGTGESGQQIAGDILGSTEYAALHSNQGITVH